jgi:transcriptional regulator with GAF, ATPase, and Fis domain
MLSPVGGPSKFPYPMLLGASPLMEDLRGVVQQVASSDSTVLILGESGTGKEVVAQSLHHHSGRRGPLVAINCGAIPASLLESELFGHERGAFTNAVSNRVGRFEQAHEGTLFLDEVGELNSELQVKLLRVLQERTFERVGGVRSLRVDARILAATNQDLEVAVQEGRFRADLFYRLNVISLKVPPLRSRKSDIPLFVNHFIRRFNQRTGTTIEGISMESTEILQRHDWPGNVRELENVIERVAVMKRTGRIEMEDLGALGVKDACRESLLCEPGKDELEAKSTPSHRNPTRFLQMNIGALNQRLRRSKLPTPVRPANTSAL